jgi:formylmethanofuran dehydrogenase subunit E-like metal-binding protein
MGCTLTKEQLDRAVAFHGHECPGLTIGLRAAELCLHNSGTMMKTASWPWWRRTCAGWMPSRS